MELGEIEIFICQMSIEVSQSEVTLSAKGLTNLIRENYANDFTFIVNGKEFACPCFVAEFLSRRISKLRRIDCTMKEMKIENGEVFDCFGKFLSLGFGSSVIFEKWEIPLIRSICIELESMDLCEELFEKRGDELTEENVIELMKDCESIGCSCESVIAFVASRFFNLNKSSFVGLNVSLISRILNHPSLTIETEDSLWETISFLIKNDPDYCMLLECIEYIYLSISSIESFINVISESFEFLTIVVWNQLRSRLISGHCSIQSGRKRHLCLPFREGSPFEGIILFLTRTYCGNVSDLGIVSISSSSVYSDRVAKNVADFNTSSIGQTDDQANGWICYDFKDQRVKIQHYSLRSRSDSENNHPINWALEGSVNGIEWVELDRRSNCRDLCELNKDATVSASGNDFFRMIRLLQ
jgi:hypothetical protein